MNEKKKYFPDARIIIGISIIIFGVLALLSNLSIPVNGNAWDYWPLILLVIGFGILIQPKEKRQYFNGIVLLALGGLFLAKNFTDGFDFKIADLWPLLVLIIGIKIIIHAISRPGKIKVRTAEGKGNTISKDYLDLSANLSEASFNIDNKDLKGGKISVVMGECNVNLREADFKGDSLTMEISTVMGAICLMVPNTWEVVMQGTPVMGSMKDKTNHYSDIDKSQKKRLIINGISVMGSIDIIN